MQKNGLETLELAARDYLEEKNISKDLKILSTQNPTEKMGSLKNWKLG